MSAAPDPPWAPADDVERRLLAAASAGDIAEAMGLLATVPLFLPGLPDEPDGGRRLVTGEQDGVRYLLVFTSVSAVERAAGAGGWRQTSLPELVSAWPELGPEPLGLAVNPATPIEVLVAPEAVAELLPAPDVLASFTPANEVERVLRDALAAPDGEVLRDVLVTSQVVVTARALAVDGEWTVPVFTSPQRCAEYLAAVGVEVATVDLDLVAVLQQWPGAGYRLAVNPGSPIGFTLDGDRVPGLLAHAAELARSRPRDPAAPGAATGSSDDVADLLRG